jgi:hypothetical protein
MAFGTARAAAARRPVGTAVLVAGGYTVAIGGWLLLPWPQGTGSAGGWAVLVGIDATRVAVAAALLGGFGLWRVAGFATPVTRRRLRPALPLLLLPLLPMVLGPGLADRPGWRFAVAAVSLATVAFGEEAVFRAVALRLLLARGTMPAVLGSAALFGAMHLVNLLTGSHPITVGAQVLMAFGIGIGFAAVALVSGTIWPLVVVHFATDLVNAIQAAVPVLPAGVTVAADTDLGSLLAGAAVNLVLGSAVAAYGLWLLHRRHWPADDAVDRPATVPSPQADLGDRG